jgi:hypothetical protein
MNLSDPEPAAAFGSIEFVYGKQPVFGTAPLRKEDVFLTLGSDFQK